jgi:hypothetical protein
MHQVSALNNLGNLCRGMGQPARGRGSLLESLAIAEDTGNAVILPFVLINLALVELDLGELDVARDYGERALVVVRKGADRQIEIGCHATLARIELARCELIPARTHIRAAALIARELKHLPHLLDTAVNSATALRLEGSPESAAVIVYMVQSHPSAGQPDRDAVERELAALRPVLPQHKLEQARADASSISLEEVISRAIGAEPPS